MWVSLEAVLPHCLASKLGPVQHAFLAPSCIVLTQGECSAVGCNAEASSPRSGGLAQWVRWEWLSTLHPWWVMVKGQSQSWTEEPLLQALWQGGRKSQQCQGSHRPWTVTHWQPAASIDLRTFMGCSCFHREAFKGHLSGTTLLPARPPCEQLLLPHVAFKGCVCAYVSRSI